MTKIDSLRRLLFPCFTPSSADSPPTTTTTISAAASTKKRISTSLRVDPEITLLAAAYQEPKTEFSQETHQDPTSPESTIADSDTSAALSLAPPRPRPSKTMVIGTVFGTRPGHVWFCFQHDRLSHKPLLLLELSIPTHQLVKEMQFGLVRIALESTRPELTSCRLRSIPSWTTFCNGKKLGFASKRKANEKNKLMLKTLQSMTVGAGVIPAGFASPDSEEILYMRANYEHVVGSADSESFHMINPDESSGQELSVFLMRSR